MSRQSQDTQESNKAGHLDGSRQPGNGLQSSGADPADLARSYARLQAAQLSLTGSTADGTSPRTEHDSSQMDDHAGRTSAGHGSEVRHQASGTTQRRSEAQEASLVATELDILHAALAREEVDDAERTRRVDVIEWAFRNQEHFD